MAKKYEPQAISPDKVHCCKNCSFSIPHPSGGEYKEIVYDEGIKASFLPLYCTHTTSTTTQVIGGVGATYIWGSGCKFFRNKIDIGRVENYGIYF